MQLLLFLVNFNHLGFFLFSEIFKQPLYLSRFTTWWNLMELDNFRRNLTHSLTLTFGGANVGDKAEQARTRDGLGL